MSCVLIEEVEDRIKQAEPKVEMIFLEAARDELPSNSRTADTKRKIRTRGLRAGLEKLTCLRYTPIQPTDTRQDATATSIHRVSETYR